MTMYDVARIAGLEGKEIGSFLQFLEADDRDAMAFRAGGRMLKMVLRAQGGKCIYHNPSSRLKCSIQDSKPAVCLAYPMKFLLKNESGFMDNALCPAENLAKARTVIPQKTLIDARWEWERHLEIVSDWNSSSRGNEDASEFFAFAAREIEAEKTPLGSLLRRARRAFRKR
jgi:Fe-S-cluster containining protein